jgi:hypothetical protein
MGKKGMVNVIASVSEGDNSDCGENRCSNENSNEK